MKKTSNTQVFAQASLFLALAAVYPLQAHAAAGIAQFTAGEVSVRKTSGALALAKGGSVDSGDTIVTSDTGRAQIRFTDGGLVSLAPNSRFSIDNYVDAQDGKQDKFLVNLLQGGMRALTGLIGKRNRDNYKVMTTTATIGIRGSGFNLAYNSDGSLSVTTELDAIEVCNKAGCVGLTAGESALVKNSTDAPARTNVRATTPPPPPAQQSTEVGNKTEKDGGSTAVAQAPKPAAETPTPSPAPSPTPTPSPAPTPTPSPAPTPAPAPASTVLAGVGFAGIGFIGQIGEGIYFNRDSGDGALVLDANGIPTEYLSARSPNAKGVNAGTAVLANASGTVAGGDRVLLGTWSSATWNDTPTTPATAQTVTPFNFVTGQTTPDSALLSNTLVGMRGEYAFTAATPVFSSRNNLVVGSVMSSSKLTVDFLGTGNFVDVSLDILFPATNPVASTSESPQLTQNTVLPTYKLRGSVGTQGSYIAGNVTVSNTACNNGTSNCGKGAVAGGFFGPTAGRAGLSFVGNSTEHGTFGGAASFALAAPVVAPATVDGVGYTMVLAHKDIYKYNLPDEYIGNSIFKGELVTSHLVDNGNNDSTLLMPLSNSVNARGSIGLNGESDFIGWGYWSLAKKVDTVNSPVDTLNIANVHYLIGKPTSYMPNAGTARYDLISGSAPTLKDLAGNVTTGAIESSSHLLTNFGTGNVTVNINTRSAGNTAINFSETARISGGQFNNGSVERNISVSGMFTGAFATRAGVVYNASTTSGQLQGAAIFGRTSSSGLAAPSP